MPSNYFQSFPNKDNDPLCTKRRAIGTDFSKIKRNNRHNLNLYVYDGKLKYNYIIEGNKEFSCSWWWLRTQGNTSSRAFFIVTRDSIRSYGQVTLACYGVRPAFKLDLQQK